MALVTMMFPAGSAPTDPDREKYWNQLQYVQKHGTLKSHVYAGAYSILEYAVDGQRVLIQEDDDLGIPYSMVVTSLEEV